MDKYNWYGLVIALVIVILVMFWPAGTAVAVIVVLILGMVWFFSWLIAELLRPSPEVPCHY